MNIDDDIDNNIKAQAFYYSQDSLIQKEELENIKINTNAIKELLPPAFIYIFIPYFTHSAVKRLEMLGLNVQFEDIKHIFTTQLFPDIVNEITNNPINNISQTSQISQTTTTTIPMDTSNDDVDFMDISDDEENKDDYFINVNGAKSKHTKNTKK